ncbi:hypothetical protein B0H14DRAFT_3427796 [Mycena olivaceomarginata]|nr:hypothetical protein B0H14DRAFT_3427796 [Mycena olivaceomarginata]
MLGFKFVSLPALILLALGAVAQDTYVEPVPLYGQCGTIVGTKPCARGKCCYIHPDDGICLLRCPKPSA